MQKITLFVYGTLKRGFRNHDNFCKNASAVEIGYVNGTLYGTGHGFPVLCVPPGSILAVGNRDYHAGAALQARVSRDLAKTELRGSVKGELISFTNPEDILPIDRLEGVPHFYRRVLIPARIESGRVLAAWAYVMPRPTHGATVIESGEWNE